MKGYQKAWNDSFRAESDALLYKYLAENFLEKQQNTFSEKSLLFSEPTIHD